MSLAISLFPEPMRSLVAGSISATYAKVGTPLVNPSRILLIQNQTDSLLVFSFDGVNDHIPIPSQGFVLFDCTTNKTVEVGAFIASGIQFYVKQIVAPTVGSVYISTVYGTRGSI